MVVVYVRVILIVLIGDIITGNVNDRSRWLDSLLFFHLELIFEGYYFGCGLVIGIFELLQFTLEIGLRRDVTVGVGMDEDVVMTSRRAEVVVQFPALTAADESTQVVGQFEDRFR